MGLQIRCFVEGKQEYVELYGDEDIIIEISFAEIEDITRKNSVFTKEFKVPGSKNNNRIFDYFYEINAVGLDWKPRKKFTAELIYDGYEIYSGYIRLNSVTINKLEKEYSITFYNQVGDLAANIKDKFLSDLDLSHLSHPFNDQVFLQSQLDPELFSMTGATNYSYQNGKTFWGLYNIGYNYTTGATVDYQSTPLLRFSSGSTATPTIGNFDFSGSPIQNFYPKPTIQIKELYEQIFEQGGYKIESEFLNTSYFKKFYLPLKFLDDTVYSRNATQPCYTFSELKNFTSVLAPTPWVVGAPTCDNGFLTASSQTVSNDVLVIPAPYTGEYVFRIDWTGYTFDECYTSTPTYNWDLYANGNLFSSNSRTLCGASAHTWSQTFAGNVTGTTALQLQHYGYDIYLLAYTFQIISGPRFITGDVDYSLEFPENDYKQLDFITSVNKMFNLLVIQHPTKSNTLIVEPMIDWIGKGDVLDWTTKIDYDSPITISPTTTIINGTLFYEFRLDKDYANQQYNTSSNRVFGSEYIQLDQEYKDQITRFTTIFSSPIDLTLNNIDEPQITIPSMSALKQSDVGGQSQNLFQPYKMIPRMIFRGMTLPNDNWGFIDGFNYQTWYYTTNQVDRWQELQRFTTYPNYFNDVSHYLTFRSQDTFDPLEQVYPNAKDMYDIYYSDYIEDLINDENKIYKAKIYLTPFEIQQLTFDEKILIKSTYFRINKISNFNLLEPSLCDIELVKLTRDYTPHPVRYLELISCADESKLYTNTDLNFNLINYIGMYVKLYDDSLTYLGCYEVSPSTYNSSYNYQHFYISPGYPGSLVGAYPDCFCNGRTPLEFFQETPIVYTQTPTPSPTATNTPTPTYTPTTTPTPSVTIGLTPTATETSTPTPTPSGTPDSTPTPTPTIPFYSCTLYQNNEFYVASYNYVDCNGNPYYCNQIYPGQQICVQDGTLQYCYGAILTPGGGCSY